MTPQTNISNHGSYRLDPNPKIGDNDGVTDKALNAALFILCSVLLVLSLATTALAQDNIDPVLKEMTTSALMDMNYNNFEDALEKFITVQGHAPSASIDHLLGVCYFNLGNNVAAEIHLENAIQDLVEEEDEWSPFSEKAPIHALNYLGKVHYDRADFGNAIEYFSRFLVSLYVMEDTDKWLIEWTEEIITHCEELQLLSDSRPF
ncbi:MAG: tetratricopeptide (TPR) repeat protein [Granulosicoccus sp.]|jgi:tetratricopeptide (TPR) repeat protein